MTSEEKGDLVVRALMAIVRKQGGRVTVSEADLSEAGTMALLLEDDPATVTVVVSYPDELLQ